MDEIVRLDVGGHLYTTTRSTLTRYPETMLGAMFSGRMPSTRDPNGAYIIDGDGPVFRYVLNFLRRGKLYLPDDFKDWDLLVAEADFYQIPDFVDTVMAAKPHGSGQEDDGCQSEEFVEITLQEEDSSYISHKFTYTGSTDVLEKILPIMKAFQDKPGGEIDSFSENVEEHGSWTMSIRRSTYSFEAVRMDIFWQLYQLGFKLKTSSVHLNKFKKVQKIWLFGRKSSKPPHSDTCILQ